MFHCNVSKAIDILMHPWKNNTTKKRWVHEYCMFKGV